MAKRSSKTAAQQCRYYEVDNIFVYMVETYINGNISVFRELYRELNKDARRDFTDFLLSEVEPTYWREILKRKHSINSPFHSKKCDITFVIKVKKLNCYVTSMDHGRF